MAHAAFLPAVRKWRPHAASNKFLKPHVFDKRSKGAHSTDLGSLTRAFGRQELPLPMVLAWLVWQRPCSPSRHFLDGAPAGSLSPNSRPRLSPSEVRQRSSRKPRSIGPHLTRIRSGKPPRARWSAATFFGLYRMMTSLSGKRWPLLRHRHSKITSPVLVPTQRHLVAVVPPVATAVEEAAA